MSSVLYLYYLILTFLGIVVCILSQCPHAFSSLSLLNRNVTAEKDEDTKLALIGDSKDFLTVYGKPIYVINEMSGQPISLLRLGYPDIDTGLFTDDDFMLYNNVTTEF